MFVGAALMLLALEEPSPLAADADGEAILGEINAGDPAITKPPAPLERLVAAAELAEEKLRAADEPDAMFDMLTLSAAARKVAYGRTGEAVHLCRLVAAAERNATSAGHRQSTLPTAPRSGRAVRRRGTPIRPPATANPALRVPVRGSVGAGYRER